MNEAIKRLESFPTIEKYPLRRIGDFIVESSVLLMGVQLCIVGVFDNPINRAKARCIGMTPSPKGWKTEWFRDGLERGWDVSCMDRILPNFDGMSPFINNDYDSSGLPPEHHTVNNVCSLPLIFNSVHIGFILVGNRESDFDDAFIEYVRPFVECVTRKIHKCLEVIRTQELEQYQEIINYFEDNIAIVECTDGENCRFLAYNESWEEEASRYGQINTEQNIIDLFPNVGVESNDMWRDIIINQHTFDQIRSYTDEQGNKKHYKMHSFPHKFGAMMISHDVSELVEQRISAEKANELKNEFLSKISHELRTPLNSILGFAQLLMIKNKNIILKDYIESIIQSGDMLLNLINEILDLSKIESGKMFVSLEPINIITCLNEVVTSMTMEASDNGVTVQCSCLADLSNTKIMVMGNAQRYKQIFMNLISNAIKFNKHNGTVTVTCSIDPDDETVHIAIEDTGVGIPESKIGRLYEPFDRLDRHEFEGTGLGLPLSKSLLDMMGARITLHSEVGVGSTFTVIAKIEELIKTDVVDVKYRVVYIEDNIQNHILVENIVGLRDDIILYKALRGESGLELIHEYQPNLILLDMNLPDINGEEVVRRLRPKLNTQYNIVIVSADAYTHRIDNALKNGVKEYITKPFQINKFMSMLETYLPSTHYPTPPGPRPAFEPQTGAEGPSTSESRETPGDSDVDESGGFRSAGCSP